MVRCAGVAVGEGTEFSGLHGQQQDELPADLLDGLTQFDQLQLLGTVFQTLTTLHITSACTRCYNILCACCFLPCLQKQSMPEANLENLHIVHTECAAVVHAPVVLENLCTNATKQKGDHAES